MPQFRYVARAPGGKLVEGVVDVADRAAAIRQVEQQKAVPIKIEPVAPAPTPGNPSASTSKAEAKPERISSPATQSTTPTEVQTMSSAQLYLFTEQLANLLGAGMTLDEALGILVRRMKAPKLQAVSKGLHQGLVDGRSLSQTLRDYPRIFEPLYVNLVAAGEASGALADILRRLVAHLSEVKALRDKVQQALYYPVFLVLAGVGLVILFITVMVPQLQAFFKESGGKLPASTQLLLASNDFLKSYWWLALLGIAGLFTGFRAFTSSPQGRKIWDTFIWKVPVYSAVLRNRYYAQFARTLGTLLENGVTLLRALELLEEVSGNVYVQEKMALARKAVVDGAPLSKAVGEQQVFPELFIDMMSVGEQTGRLGETVGNIADVYEREVDKQVKLLSALIPPMVMMVIAAIVGFVVFGILTAVFSMTQGLSGRGR